MKPKLLLKLMALLAMLAVGITANATIWVGANLGSPGISGSVVTNGDGSLTITAGGDDIWNGSDNGFYYYTWVNGNWDAKVRVQSLATASSTWAKTEMMVRWSDPNVGVQGNDGFLGAMCAAAQSPSNQQQYRPVRAAGAANNLAGAVNVALNFPNNWLRVTKTNSVITLYAGNDGTTWTQLAQVDTANDTAHGFTTWPDLVTVGVAVTAHNNGTTTTSTVDPPILSTSGSSWTPPSASGIQQDVANKSTYVGSEASFSFTATNNGVPVGFPMAYQWYQNGVQLPGITGTAYTWLAAATNAGTNLQCVAWPTINPSLTVTSSVGTLSVSSSTILITNILKMEVFANHTRQDMASGNTSAGDTGNRRTPGKLRWLTTFDDPGAWGDNTSRRVSGFFIPWADGAYTFYAACDDDTDVYLSSDANPANKVIICQEMGWSGMNNWTNADSGGAGETQQKSSDTWTNGSGTIVNPAGITLSAGQRYYIECDEHNGGGGDNLGVYAKLFTDPPPANGTPSTLDSSSNNIVAITWQPTSISFAPTAGIQPTNVTVFEGQAATFYARAATDSEFEPHYQWQAFGTNLPGVTGSTYTLNPTIASQNGYHVDCVATVPGLSSITSAVATLTINSAVFEPGFVLERRWNGQPFGFSSMDQVVNGSIGPPNYVAAIPGLEASINGETGDNYTRSVEGFVIPPTNGLYDFYVTADDYAYLLLSTDANPANKVEIARENAWSNPFNWTADDGSGSVWLKNSVTHTNASDGGVPPHAGGISMTGGTKYFVQLVHNEGGGGDNVESAMVAHGVTPVNGADYAPAGSWIGINAPKANWVMFTLQPTNPPPVEAGATATADFYAFGTTDSTIAVGSTRANGPGNTEVANQFVFFQWFKNGVALPGQTASHLAYTGIHGFDNNAQFMCQMRALGYGQAPNTHFWSNSATATLTVTTNPAPPTLLYSGQYYNQNQIPAATFITLTFNLPMDPITLTNPASYTVAGANVVAVFASADNRRVQLQLDAAPTFPTTVTFTGLRTWSGIALTSGSTSVSASAIPPGLTFIDIGLQDQTTFITDPVWPSYLWAEGTGSGGPIYTVAAEGSDIWDTHDGFNFLYEQKSGNFDVVVRQINYGLSSPWAKFGLMVRDLIDDHLSVADPTQAGRSRNWNVVNDPANVPVIGGNGANTVECNGRPAGTNVASAVWQPNGGANGFNQLLGFPPAYPSAWVRIKRSGPDEGGNGGQTLTAFAGVDGHTWFELATEHVTSPTFTNSVGTVVTNSNPTPMPLQMYVGICTTGHNNDSAAAPMLSRTGYNYSTFDSYSSSYAGGNPSPTPPTLSLSLGGTGGTNVVASWAPAGGILQSSTDLVNWNNVTLVSPVTNAPTAAKLFYRVWVQAGNP